ncbi:MAG: response regulator [Polaribacter sp.]
MYKIRLMLVDDHILFTQGLSAALTLEDDIEIIGTFSDAKEALTALKHTQPDLLITDISMPTMHGLEFIKKAKTRYPTLKILVVSMFQELVSLKHIDGYLSKNTSIEEFSKAIRTIVLEDKKYTASNTTHTATIDFYKNTLTKREKEVVEMIANQSSVNEIAEKLFISRSTVEFHKKNIFYKLDVNTNAGLVKKSIQLGFLS